MSLFFLLPSATFLGTTSWYQVSPFFLQDCLDTEWYWFIEDSNIIWRFWWIFTWKHHTTAANLSVAYSDENLPYSWSQKVSLWSKRQLATVEIRQKWRDCGHCRVVILKGGEKPSKHVLVTSIKAQCCENIYPNRFLHLPLSHRLWNSLILMLNIWQVFYVTSNSHSYILLWTPSILEGYGPQQHIHSWNLQKCESPFECGYNCLFQ